MGSVTQLRPRARRRRRRWPAVLLTLAAVGTGLYLWNPASPRTAAQAEPEPLSGVRHGVLQVTLDADAVLVRREQVYRAPEGGTLRRLAAEGARVRVGGQVVAFSPGAGPPVPAARTDPRSTPAESALPRAVSAARQAYDRLAAELYAAAVALQEAQLRGEATAPYQERLDELAREQLALLPALREDMARAGTEAAPLPPPAGEAAPQFPPAGEAGPQSPLPGSERDPQEEGWHPAFGEGEGDFNVITTPVSGVVLYQTDGLETVLTPEAVAGWGPAALYTLPYPDTREIADGPVAAGDPLFKLVDDLTVEMLLLVPADSLTEAQQAALTGQEVELQVAGRDLPLTARVLRVAADGQDLLIHLESPLPSSDALRLRRMRVSVLLAEYEGVILPRTAIDVEDGRTGVWVAQRGGYRFVPVRVLGGTADEVAVEGDLPPDAQVLTAPPPPSSAR